MSDAPSFYNGFFQPESAANTDYQPIYPYNNVKQTRSGHMFEMDDTNSRERVRLQHRTGTFIEMQPNGDEVHKVYGDGYEIIIKDKHVQIQGKCVIEVLGDAFIHVAGDKTETVDGNVMQHIKGNYTQVVEGLSSITSQGNLNISGGAGVAGKVSISSGSVVSLDSDLRVRGEIGADKIYSFGRIDAATGISAGPLGFVSMTGGMSIGIPVAVPGNIICVGSMNAGASVTAIAAVNGSTGNFGIMTAGLMTDTINTGLYDVHTHIDSKGGLTATPLPKMV
jgi:hypothetical protein